MYVLECGKYAGIARWSKDGKSFVVIDPKAFEINVLPSLFKTSQFESFVRKLCRWGFAKRSGTACRFGMMPTAIWFCHASFQKGKFALCSTDVRCNSKVDTQASRTLLNLAEDEALENRKVFSYPSDVSVRNTMNGSSALEEPLVALSAYSGTSIGPDTSHIGVANPNNGRRRTSAPQNLIGNQASLVALQENAMRNPSLNNMTMPGLYDQQLLAHHHQHQSLGMGSMGNQQLLSANSQRSMRAPLMEQRQMILEDSSAMSLLNGGAQQHPCHSDNSMLQRQHQGNNVAHGQGLLQQHRQELFLAELERTKLLEQRNMASRDTQALQQELILLELQRKNMVNRARNLNAPPPPANSQDMFLRELQMQNLMHMQNQQQTNDFSRSSMRR